MKVTDLNLIEAMVRNASCVTDGMTSFIKQGEIAVDLAGYHQKDGSALYLLDIYKRKPEFENCDTFFNISCMTGGNIFEMFDKESEEGFTEHSEALARIFFLMQEHSHLADA